ncbi:MAG: alpha/beta hydrolase [Rhodospirillales bacterium]
MTLRKLVMDDGVRIAVEEAGPRDAPVLLFAHEFGGDMRTWDRLVGRLSHRYRCLRFAARGFDPSECPSALSSYGQDRATSDLLAVASMLADRPVHLVGCSMGSFTALLATLRSPECVRSLTLIGCSSGPAGAEARQHYRRALKQEIALLEAEGGVGAVAWFAQDPAYRRPASKCPDDWQAYLRRLERQAVRGALNTLRSLHWDRPALQDYEEALATLALPLLILHGLEDHPSVETTATYLAKRLTPARCIAVPETGHLVHIEEPDLVERELRALLAAAEGP